MMTSVQSNYPVITFEPLVLYGFLHGESRASLFAICSESRLLVGHFVRLDNSKMGHARRECRLKKFIFFSLISGTRVKDKHISLS